MKENKPSKYIEDVMAACQTCMEDVRVPEKDHAIIERIYQDVVRLCEQRGYEMQEKREWFKIYNRERH